MAIRSFESARRAVAAAVVLVAALNGAGVWAQAPEAEVGATLAAPETLTVAVFSGARPDSCYDNGYAQAVRMLGQAEAARINRSGMLGSRRLELKLLDGDSDAETAKADLRAALAEPALLGLVGMSRSQIAKESFAELGPEIAASGAPFVSAIGLQAIFAPYPNVFSLRVSQEEEQVPVIRAFLSEAGYVRPGFVGRKGAVASEALGDGLATRSSGALGPDLVADIRLELPPRTDPAPEQLAETVAALQAAGADVVFLNIGSRGAAALMAEMTRIGFTPAVFVSGRIESLFRPERLASYPAPVHQLAWSGLPHIFSERLRRLIERLGDRNWVFGGVKNEKVAGWADGSCAENADSLWSSVYAQGNLRAATRGAEYADMIGLIAEAAAGAPRRASLSELRAHVAETLARRFAAGGGAFEGRLANWSFRPETRTATRAPAIVERPAGVDSQRLAPIQYVRVRGEALRRIQTYYLDIDLARIFRVDDNAGTFFAEMTVSLVDDGGASLDKLDFGNAFLDPDTNQRAIEIVELHDGGPSDAYPERMKLYRVSGRFMFEPSFEVYPFDTQRFSIDLQPKRGDEPMILQPPAPELRDRVFDTDGWSVREQYVSYDEDFTPMVNAKSGERNIAPFYKASFVWIMDRQATDYYLRVAVPLMVILAIAYLSIFISKEHFEAIVTIQVTALLSAVALYLAIPKVESDSATLSDKIFLVDYCAVFLMIATSILRANRVVKRIPALPAALDVIHVVAVPVIVGMMGWYVYELSRPRVDERSGISELAGEQAGADVEASMRSR